MTTPGQPIPPSSETGDSSSPPEMDLDGHSIEQLSDYLDRVQAPPDPSIDNSPGCQIALAALVRLRNVSASLLDQDVMTEPVRDDTWVADILSNISREAHAGRDIRVHHNVPSANLAITEGAVRGMIRAAGDAVGGVIIGRCRLDGDVTIPGVPVSIRVDASVFWGERIPDAANRVREAIYAELRRHTELIISSVDVTVHDVQFVRDRSQEVE